MHDLFFPGYLRADIERLWMVPGIRYHEGMTSYDLDNPQLMAAFRELQRQETASGTWALGGTKLPFGRELQERFPLVGRFLSNNEAATSRLSPEAVATTLSALFRMD